jgi:hypothetical protein
MLPSLAFHPLRPVPCCGSVLNATEGMATTHCVTREDTFGITMALKTLNFHHEKAWVLKPNREAES